MAKRLKRPRDPISLAKLIGDIATGQVVESADDAKVNAASELGRLGGLKGGKARSESLPPERRSEIARAAAKSRWRK